MINLKNIKMSIASFDLKFLKKKIAWETWSIYLDP